ncbi:MAG TPA: hypothetical protein VIU93_07845 [Gallionellaceae bacterium]
MNKGLWLFGMQVAIIVSCVYSISVTPGHSPGEPGILIPLLLLLVTPPIFFGFGFRLSQAEKSLKGSVAKYLNAAGLVIYLVWFGQSSFWGG